MSGGADPMLAVLERWASWEFWVFVLVVAFFGALGGLVYELMNQRGRIELPHRTREADPDEAPGSALPRSLYDLGIFGRMIIGALAAIVVVWPLGVVDEGALAVVSVAILAGAAGIAVFRSLQDRLLAALATRELVKTRDQAEQSALLTAEAEAELRQMIGHRQISGRGVNFGIDAEGAEPSPEMESVLQKLGSARALALAAGAPRVSVRLRTYRVLAAWAGLPVTDVPPDTKPIATLWLQSSANPQISDGHLSDLIVRLQTEFPRAELRLAPADLKPGGRFDTLVKLVAHVERMMLGRE
jgi:hypothetical protein